MVLNTQPIENKGYSEQNSPYAAKSFNLKELIKKPALLVIAVVIFLLWLISPKLAWMKDGLSYYLPIIGGFFLVSEQLIKLI